MLVFKNNLFFIYFWILFDRKQSLRTVKQLYTYREGFNTLCVSFRGKMCKYICLITRHKLLIKKLGYWTPIYFVVLVIREYTRYVHKITVKSVCSEYSGILCRNAKSDFRCNNSFRHLNMCIILRPFLDLQQGIHATNPAEGEWTSVGSKNAVACERLGSSVCIWRQNEPSWTFLGTRKETRTYSRARMH